MGGKLLRAKLARQNRAVDFKRAQGSAIAGALRRGSSKSTARFCLASLARSSFPTHPASSRL